MAEEPEKEAAVKPPGVESGVPPSVPGSRIRDQLSRFFSKLRSVPKEDELKKRAEDLKRKEEDLRRRSEKLDQEEVGLRETKEKNLQEQEDALNRKELEVSQGKEEDLRRRERELDKKEKDLEKKEEKLRSDEARLRSKKEEEIKNKEKELKIREEELKKKEEEVKKKQDEEPKRFSDKKYLLPFGRYVGSTEVEPPADEVLVGREGQRAYLIDLLISSGRRGAYLVTGHRGAGKTSFVKYCISEYEASVFSRFLRGNVGRGIWDRLLVLLFWMSILVGALLATELVQFLVSSAVGSDENLLQWVILLPIGIVMLYPCVYAKVVLETCIRAAAKKGGTAGSITIGQGVETDVSRWAGVAALLIVLGLSVAAWVAPYSGRPAVGISLLIPLVCALYATVQAVSFRREGDSWGLVWIWMVYLIIALILLAVLYESISLSSAIVYPLSFPGMPEDELTGPIFRGNLALGLILFGFGSIFRSFDQKERLPIIKPEKAEALKDAMRWGSRWYFLFGFSLFISGSLLLLKELPDKWSLFKHWTVPLILLVAFLPVRESVREGEDSQKSTNRAGTTWSFQPRPMWVLTAKAVFSIVIALQLAYPILSFLTARSAAPFLDRWRLACPTQSLCHASLSRWTPFSGRIQEEFWLMALLMFIVLFHLVEYEWVIRPYVRSREGQAFGAGGLAPWDEREPDTASESKRRALHNLAELTLPWQTYKAWLPVLPVAVNLGFDRLDHRRVIQTMLVGLRERYHRTFLAWNSGFANLGRFLGLLALVVLTASISRLLPTPEQPKEQPKEPYTLHFELPRTNVVASNEKPVELSFGEKILLTVIKGYMFFSVPATPDEHLLLFDLLPHWPPEKTGLYSETVVYIGLYHFLLFLLLFFFGHLVIHRMPLLPYKQNLRRVDDLLDSLSARTKITSSLNLWGPARWVYSIFSDERIRETERDPVDPRTMELAFLQILDDVQKGGFRFPGAARHHLTMPAPEITFMFDELDKLGTRVDLMEETRDPAAPKQEIQVIHNERERSLKLRSLLSDLKNILTSAPARFIFVGGRDLHDEWLADQTSRMPLLTSIFNTEVYLPSLLTDQRDPDTAASPLERRREGSPGFLHERIEEYVKNQYRRALLLYQRSVRKRWLPSFGLPVETLAPERFALVSGALSLPDVLDSSTGRPIEPGERDLLMNDFMLFLTHRSMGNPKKLKDLLSGFIRPAGREFDSNLIRWSGTPYRHVIKLGDVEIFRIQLLVTIYRHLTHAFEERMVRRDDKYSISIFHLTDFLFKFHRRAFSWSNLERVDDLAHIHRLPDLREIQEEIVDHFSERFLHRVTNGIYSFRFRSDVAREVEYLSRRSPAEMAAFNFTLDESLSLKSEYLAAIEGSERNNPDLVAALGELYEFDQDFERARHQYRVAIKLLDRDLVHIKGAKQKDAAKALYNLVHGKVDEHTRIVLPWGVARLRLMLQIGMTFELERDLEQAEAEYRSARILARALVRASLGEGYGTNNPAVDERAAGLGGMFKGLLRQWTDLLQADDTSQVDAGTTGMGVLQNRPRRWEDWFHSLKHMNILFQPMFAEAWLAEKFFGSVDTSVTLIERALWEVRGIFPFVWNPRIPVVATTKKGPEGSIQVYETPDWEKKHANFSLMLLQLHNKAGDLYFFKGRQPVTPEQIKRGIRTTERDDRQDQPTDGYLLRAHYHYGVSLHDLRRYIQYRVLRSQELSIAENKTPTLLAKALPDFLFRAAAGSINDMAEATLARISLFKLFEEVRSNDNIPGSGDERFKMCLKWLETGYKESDDKTLINWFGNWIEHPAYKGNLVKLIEFRGPDKAGERLLMSLDFCRVGAHFLEKGGYPEDAGRELLQVCETVTRYLWWGLAVERLGEAPGRSGDQAYPWWDGLKAHIKGWQEKTGEGEALPMSGLFANTDFWRELITLGIKALEKIETLFRQSRYSGRSEAQRAKEGRPYLIGRIIPPEALTLLCSLRLGAVSVPLGLNDRIDDLVKRWLGTEEAHCGIGSFAAILEGSVQRHAYPMINRLKGMKVLIDNLVLKPRKDPDAQEEADFQQALEWTLELLNLNEQFDAPLHFTPSHSGMTCALVWLWGAQRFAGEGNRDVLDRIHRAAQRDLANSEEMYTMRRSYYEAISGLYYLYDDFNDRQIHFNHAIQMAGAELNAILKFLVDEADELRRKPAPKS